MTDEFRNQVWIPTSRFFKATWKWIKKGWFCLPLVGETEGTSLRDWINASNQFGFTWLFSILPPLIAWFAASLDVHRTEPFQFGINEVLKPGEIVVSSLAFIAPAVWMTCEHLLRGKRFRNYPSFTILIFIIFGFSLTIFIKEQSGIPLDGPQVLSWGVWIYGASLFLAFLSILYSEKFGIPYEEAQQHDEHEMVDELKGYKP